MHVPCAPPKNEKCREQPLPLTDLGPPCSPWRTTEVGSVQRRLVVHNVVLYVEVVHNICLTTPDTQTDGKMGCGR